MQEFLQTDLYQIAGAEIKVIDGIVFLAILLASYVAARLLEGVLAWVIRLRGADDETITVLRLLVRYLILLIGLSVALYNIGIVLKELLQFDLFTIAGTEITVADAILFFVIILMTFIIARLLEGGTTRAFKLRGVEDEGTIGVARRLVHYVILLIGFSLALTNIGINLGALFAAGALFAVALGFAMQNIAENFVSGVIILLERAIKPGDVLEVDGTVVRVVKMGIRSTVARSRQEEELIIPNSILVQNLVKNFTLQDRLYRIRTIVGVVYSSDMRLVRETLEQVTRDLPWREKSVEPRIHLMQFGSSSVDFDVSVWIDHPWRAPTRLSDLNEAIWWALKDKDVVIAFPQMDVHLDPEVVQRLGRPST